MRITGVVSLRGNGRFIDFNSFEMEKIEYILDNYVNYSNYQSKREFFDYMGSIDTEIVSLTQIVDDSIVFDARINTLNQWATEHTKEDIANELNILSRNGESRNAILRVIDKTTRLEFLTSIALKQNFVDLDVRPNYHVDDEGLPTFTASGGVADIECYDTDCNSLVEVTLMCARNQATNEMPAITRHLQEAIEKEPNITHFSMLVAPSIHTDTKYMAGYSKYRFGINILTLTITEFIEAINKKKYIVEMLSV